MNRLNLFLLLTLLAAALLLGSLSASAEAAGGPQWFVAGSVLSKGMSVEAFGASELLEVEAFQVTESNFLCRMKWEGKLNGGEPGTDTESITLTGCELAHEPNCEINGQPAGRANIVFSSTETELVYLNTRHTEVGDLYRPAVQPFAKITLSGTTCGLRTTLELKGSAVAKIESPNRYQVSHTLEFLPSGTSYEFWDGSAFLTGKSALELGGLTSRFTGVADIELVGRKEFKTE